MGLSEIAIHALDVGAGQIALSPIPARSYTVVQWLKFETGDRFDIDIARLCLRRRCAI